MGLDTTHGCFHMSYSSFGSWRQALATAVGIDEDMLMQAWRANKDSSVVYGDWPEPPSDMVQIILQHSDCDGHINAADTGPLADRLAELLPKIDENWRRTTEQFITGLRLASDQGENVGFH